MRSSDRAKSQRRWFSRSISVLLRLPTLPTLSLLCLLPLLLAAHGCAPATRAESAGRMEIVPSPDDSTRVRVLLGGEPAAALRRRLGTAPRADELEPLFSVSVRGPQAAPQVPLLARLEWQGDREAALIPQVSLTRGLAYRAVFAGDRLSPSQPRLVADYQVPRDERSSAARVTGVYPTELVLPANLLKFYVTFSEPMAEGKVFDHARLLDAAGRVIPQAFREVELWGEDHQRLTLWINPGRTKQSLGLSESLGPVLQAERTYTLELTPGLTDQHGRPVTSRFQRSFRTTAPDRRQPRVKQWQLAPPATSRAAVTVRFPEPMDHALAARCIAVETATGRPVAGQGTVDPDGRRWSFSPAAPWRPGSYRVTAAGELEDLAGNSLFRPFETAGGSGPKPSPAPPAVHVNFRVVAP